MVKRAMPILLAAAVICCGSVAMAQSDATPNPNTGDEPVFKPLALSLQPSFPDSVYSPPSPVQPNEGINEGGVHFSLAVSYLTDYVYRGIELFEPPGAEDRTSLQIDAKLIWDLGKLPHPFIEVFVNYSDADPISSFQEIRPTLGLEWTIRPLVLSGGYTGYIYPDRDEFETAEFWGKIAIDDSYFFQTQKPLFSPYIFGAYDYEEYNGWYLEAGVSHEWEIPDTGLSLEANAHVAYVRGIDLFAVDPADSNINGFQHYQIGLIGRYSLNHLLNVSSRYGDWYFQGFIYYTDSIDDDLLANNQIWGGAGILFRY